MQSTPLGWQRIQTFSLLILATVASGAALQWLAPVMIPFVLAFFLTVVLTPIVELIHRKLRLPRILALGLAGLVGVLLVAGLGALVAESVDQLLENKDTYMERYEEVATDLIKIVGLSSLDELPVEDLVSSSAPKIFGPLINGLLSVLSNLVLVVIFMMFMVSGRARTGTLGEAEERIKSYVMTKVVVSGITGGLTWICLSLFDVEMAMVFGLLAFLLNFIPSLGSIIAVLLPLPIVLGGDYGVAQDIGAFAGPAVIQFLVGNVLEPKMLGESMDLHPVTILLALLVWGMLWGMVGALLATPITAILRILLGKMPETRPLAEWMAGRTIAPPEEPSTA